MCVCVEVMKLERRLADPEPKPLCLVFEDVPSLFLSPSLSAYLSLSLSLFLFLARVVRNYRRNLGMGMFQHMADLECI